MLALKELLILLTELCLLALSSVALENDSLYLQNNISLSDGAKSIRSEDGDVIDCINIYKQPAFDHPALRDHKIQMRPYLDPHEDPIPTMNRERQSQKIDRVSQVTITTQIWQRSGSCPQGTIPIRRAQNKYARKEPVKSPFLENKQQINATEKLSMLYENHSIAMLHTEGYSYLGAKGDIKVWNPHVESDDEYSTSQIALKSGPNYNYEAIESGWAVNPRVYGDRKTRFFVYWTVDSSQKTGCFDLICPGFVQTSNEIALGAAIYPISNPTGLPYEITVYMHKDPLTGNWWVQYRDKINIGYWPAKLFGLLKYHAETVQWGGEVYSPKVGSYHPHTATDMGSGHFSDYVMGNSGVIKRMRVLENSMILKFPEWTSSYTDEYWCYDTFYLSDYVDDPEFYFGGPGRNPMCP